jgi:hypothetical protein
MKRYLPDIFFVIACCFTFALLAHRIDAVTDRVDAATTDTQRTYKHVEVLRTDFDQVVHVYDLELQRVDQELELCRRRTDNLRGTLEVLLGELRFNGRVALPDVTGLGWPAWSKVGIYNEPGGTTNGD